jgi:ubiquinone/menaquinone biosynthesis C-methylase UbiE
MGFYSRYVLPHIVSCGCALPQIAELRRAVVPQAKGVVLEIGFGSGLNLPFYRVDRVRRVYAMEPDLAMLNKARRLIASSAVPVRVLQERAETLSLGDRSVDTVVVTFTLCTVPDVGAALCNARRVLKPGGRLLFCEHGRSPDAAVYRRQVRIEPVWKRLFGGCHLTRDIPALLRQSGFSIDLLEDYDMSNGGLRIGSYLYRGSASAAA